jgi:hypothetical protein
VCFVWCPSPRVSLVNFCCNVYSLHDDDAGPQKDTVVQLHDHYNMSNTGSRIHKKREWENMEPNLKV